MTVLLSFHNNKAVKRKYLGRVRAHAKADGIVQGTGWDNGKGCAIGCTLESYDHDRYPIELGIPVVLARLEDRIFEGLAPAEAMRWPARFLSAIRVGRDLCEVWPKFAIWLLRDVRKYARPNGKKAIDGVVGYFRLPPAERTADKLKVVRVAALAAASADAYADAYATYAALAAAADAAYAATADAADAAAAAHASDARKKEARRLHFKRQSTKLLELLGSA